MEIKNLVLEQNTFIERLKNYIGKVKGKVVINTGHFLVIHDKKQDKAVSSILGEIKNSELSDNVRGTFGDFPTDTFQMSTELLKYAKSINKECQLTILVNDWQYIKEDNTRKESEHNRYRREFYNNFTSPPSTYIKILKKNNLHLNNLWIGGDKNDYFFFRETRLRDKFKREIKKFHKQQEIKLDEQGCINDSGNFVFNQEANTYYKEMSNGRETAICTNGKVGCAGEITQLVKELMLNKNASLVINFLPISCEKPVNLGVEIAFEIYTSLFGTVINVFPFNIIIKDGDFLLSVFQKNTIE